LPGFSEQRGNFSASALIALVASVAFVTDQWSKRWVVDHIAFDASCNSSCGHMVLIPGWLEFGPVANTHGAFGMLGSSKPLLVALACIVLVVFWWSFREAAARSRLVSVAFGAIAGGALGNIVDRLHYSYVIDFIDMDRFPQIWHYPFNVGDSFITSGVVLLLISSLGARRHANEAASAPTYV